MKRASDPRSICCRTLLSLMSIGMLTPATTCAPCSLATDRLRLVWVSPNMSVTMRTPRPRSTRRTAAAIRSRISCGPSIGSLITASRASCLPTTLSRACTIASLRRPCPTTTRPTIEHDPNLRKPTAASLPSSLEIAMPHEDAMSQRCEPAPELLHQHHRAMATARAADGDRQVALALVLVARQREGEQRQDVCEKLLRVGAFQHVRGHVRIHSGLGTQLLDEERVRQEAAVEHQVGVDREAVLVPERDQGDRQRAGVGRLEELSQRGPQLVHGEHARVDDARRLAAQLAQRFALAPDAVGDRAALRGGMRTPGLAEAPHQHVVTGLEIDDLRLRTCRAQLVEDVREVAQETALPDVNPERHTADILARALPQLDESRQQRDREIVDAVEAQVLEDLQRRALTRPRQTRDDDGAEALGHRGAALTAACDRWRPRGRRDG